MTQTEQIDLDKLREEFVAWLRTKDAHEYYNFCSATYCPVGQFWVSRHKDADPSDWLFDEPMLAIHRQNILVLRDTCTFGALLSRMEALDATPAS